MTSHCVLHSKSSAGVLGSGRDHSTRLYFYNVSLEFLSLAYWIKVSISIFLFGKFRYWKILAFAIRHLLNANQEVEEQQSKVRNSVRLGEEFRSRTHQPSQWLAILLKILKQFGKSNSEFLITKSDCCYIVLTLQNLAKSRNTKEIIFVSSVRRKLSQSVGCDCGPILNKNRQFNIK